MHHELQKYAIGVIVLATLVLGLVSRGPKRWVPGSRDIRGLEHLATGPTVEAVTFRTIASFSLGGNNAG